LYRSVPHSIFHLRYASSQPLAKNKVFSFPADDRGVDTLGNKKEILAILAVFSLVLILLLSACSNASSRLNSTPQSETGSQQPSATTGAEITSPEPDQTSAPESSALSPALTPGGQAAENLPRVCISTLIRLQWITPNCR
jgi:hypothetical protein